MEILLACIVGFMYAAGYYLMMRRTIIKLIFGISLISHASNLLIFTVGRLTPGNPPLIEINERGQAVIEHPDAFADPLPQALILTAIVIGFGIQAFALVLIKRIVRTFGELDLTAGTRRKPRDFRPRG